jgi:peptidoglycan/LPS O-acetylase OafA/YrhL
MTSPSAIGSRDAALKLRSLEMLRAFAALFVVMYHTQGIVGVRFGVSPFHGLFAGGHVGVELFFVLSGFIITYVNFDDLGRPDRTGKYLFSRFRRIYPAVWIVTALAAIVYASGFGGAGASGKLSPGGIFDSAMLLPQPGDALVNVSWTLKYEIFFYLLFSLTIIHARIGVAVVALWQVASLSLFFAGEPHEWSWVAFYLRPIVLNFGIGIAGAVALRNMAVLRRPDWSPVLWVLLIAGTGVFLGGGFAEAYYPRLVAPIPSFLLFGASAGLVIVALAGLELNGRIHPPKLLVAIGGASYAIYLLHFSTIDVFTAGIARLTPHMGNLLSLLAAAGGVLAGVLFDRWIDQPIQRWLRRFSRGRKAAIKPAPAVASRPRPLPSFRRSPFRPAGPEPRPTGIVNQAK